MVLNEQNFDLLIAILAFITLIIIIFVVLQRKIFLNWFFVLFFGTLGGIIYYFKFLDNNFRILADLIYAFSFFAILYISVQDYTEKVLIKRLKRSKVALIGTLIVLLFILILSPIFTFKLSEDDKLVLFVLSLTLLIGLFSNILYIVVLTKSFSISELFYFLSVFCILITNTATVISFFGPQIYWDLSYVINITTYIFFISCSLTVYFEDQLTRISSDLDEKENILQTFIELAPVGVVLFQNESIKIVNNAMSKISGYSSSMIKTWSTSDIINIFDQNDRGRVVSSFKKAQEPFEAEYEENFIARFIDNEGKNKWGNFYLKRTKYQEKPSTFVIIIDITENIELEEKFRLAFLNSPNPIVLVDAKTDKFIIFNEKFPEMFGYGPNEIYSLTFDDLTLPIDLETQYKNYTQDGIRKDGWKLTTNKKYKRKDGTIIETVVSTSYIKVSDENQFFITQLVDISYLNDIEYYKNLINSLEKTNYELKSLTQIVSHDIKAPLLAINNLLALIESDYKDNIPEDLVEIFSNIHRKSTFTANLVKDILEYSKVGFYEDSSEPIELLKLLNEVTQLLNVPNNINFDINPQLPNLKISRVRITQVFQNLISNAIRFNDKEKGLIVIGSNKKENGFYEFFVEDNGIGIPKNELTNVFQMFKTLKKSPDSSGIGLTIVKKIIEYYGGDLTIESEEHVRTKISFTLPSSFVFTN